MFWNKYFWPSIAVLILVTLLHWVASFEGLYWTLAWYDIMMHLLGGMWVALFLLWASHTQYGGFLNRYMSIKNLIIGVIVVGLLWEGLELYMKFTDTADSEYLSDSSLDMLMDVIGGFFVAFLYRKDL